VRLRADELEDHPSPASPPVEVHDGKPPVVGEQPPPSVDPKEFGKNVAQTLFAIGAMRWGAHWELSDRESTMLGDALAPLCARALEHVTGFWAELGVVAIVLVPIVQPRMVKDRELAEQRAAAEVPGP
jgi:hypothetical protein